MRAHRHKSTLSFIQKLITILLNQNNHYLILNPQALNQNPSLMSTTIIWDNLIRDF